MLQEIFYEKEQAEKFISRLQDKGIHFQVNCDDYWDGESRIPCIVIDYDD